MDSQFHLNHYKFAATEAKPRPKKERTKGVKGASPLAGCGAEPHGLGLSSFVVASYGEFYPFGYVFGVVAYAFEVLCNH